VDRNFSPDLFLSLFPFIFFLAAEIDSVSAFRFGDFFFSLRSALRGGTTLSLFPLIHLLGFFSQPQREGCLTLRDLLL